MSLTALKLIPGLSKLVGVASIACGLMNVANGQSIGGIGDFAKAAAFGDGVRDGYTADGGIESGSAFGQVGQWANGAMAIGLAQVIKNPEYMKHLPGAWGKAFKVAYAGFIGTQAYGAVTELTTGDGQGMGDVVDAAGNGLNAAIMLSSLSTALGGKAGIKTLATSGIRVVKDLVKNA